MYKVLIVEDEMLVRVGLKNSIQWDSFDMQVVAEVPDGQAAFEAYEKYKPDLIITDLKMPVMGGMELIERIREKDNETRIIILSCIEEFDLARKAMSLGVSDYILKLTMTEEETEAVLKKAQIELNKTLSHDSVKLSPNPGMIKEKLLKEFLFYNTCSEDEFQDHVGNLKFRLNRTQLILCIMEISHFEQIQVSFKDEKGQLIKSSITNTIDELLQKFNRGEAFYENDIHYILIFSFNDINSEQILHQELYKILNRIKSALNTFFNISVSYGISSIQDGYASLKYMYKEALGALNQKFFFDTEVFFLPEAREFDNNIVEKVETLKHMTILTQLLDNQGVKDYNKKIDLLLNNMPKNSEQIREFFNELLQWTASSLYLKADNFSVIPYIHKIMQCETFDNIIQVYKKYISEITENVLKNKLLSKEVSEAVKYIRDNFQKNINLQMIAKNVELSPAYLSVRFKKELHVTYIEYLNELRVEKAKELLIETYLKSYEIAEKVGFSEDTYFSRVFKKIAGVSPNEFRRQWKNERVEDIINENT